VADEAGEHCFHVRRVDVDGTALELERVRERGPPSGAPGGLAPAQYSKPPLLRLGTLRVPAGARVDLRYLVRADRAAAYETRTCAAQ
jgi:hypothetical protein